MATKNQELSRRRYGSSALFVLCSLVLLPAADGVSAVEAQCCCQTASAGAVTDTATGSIQNAGQTVIGRTDDGVVFLHAGIMPCLRNSGVASIAGDCGNDSDIDLLDFEMIDACMTGPDGVLDPACLCLDMDDDGDVDEVDVALFQAEFTGN